MRNIIGKEISATDFDELRISVASPDDISGWSHGEVTKPETINYRTQKPERDGLFDERIFGPSKDYECYCGKYKKIRYKGIICDKCGVEVTRSIVRRERMGHIDLSVPTAHIWYIRGIPSIVGLILNLSMSDLEKVIYFSSYVTLSVDEEIRNNLLTQLENEYKELKSDKKIDIATLDLEYKQTKKEVESLKEKQLITESVYHDLSMKYGNIIRVGIGAEAIYGLLKDIDIEKELKEVMELTKRSDVQPTLKRKALRRLKVFSDLESAGIKPDWLIFTKLPVMPPDLRPMVQLDGGRFAASDLNDLYRRVINRNNRLKKLLSQGAPEVITRNEKRMLQEAVDALIDNSARRGRSAQTAGAGTRKLRSLSDMLRGKQGRFRQNLLGKRVDYSGRSVIVAGPNLKLNQCGLPKIMALELFKPFVISKLISEGHVHNVKNASKLIEEGTPEVWDILERITKESHILLNRAPTLHRLGIEAFQPILIEGKAIQVHPLVCYAYNADFDGDQMAVHVPLSEQSKWEAKNIMLSSKNLLKPASGEPVVQARYDIVFGCFYLTRYKPNAKGENKLFASKNEAILAYHMDDIDVRAKIKVYSSKEIIETSVGRILFNNILPPNMDYINDVMDNKKLKKLVMDIYHKFGQDTTAEFVDRMKDIGFEYAGISGLTISISDVFAPENKAKYIEKGNAQVEIIDKQYRRGLITEEEKTLKTVELWQEIRSGIEKEMIDGYDKESPVYLMVESGARGSFAQIIQMGGMKGLVVSPTGEIISLPVKSSFKEGLDVYEYFISTHGARKGKSDTSLRTSDAGYLTRRLVDVSQDIVIANDDCQTKEGIIISAAEGGELGESFGDRLFGRVLLKDIKSGNKKIAKASQIINTDLISEIISNNITSVEVRSPKTCIEKWGICKKCYGLDLATNQEIRIGEAVGIVAAQAIGEPGTQLTMKTFHLGGVTGEDITSGLPRVEELFEARVPKHPAIIAHIDGKIKISESKDMILVTLISDESEKEIIDIPKNYEISAKEGETVKSKQALATNKSGKILRAVKAGKIEQITEGQIIIETGQKSAEEYIVPNYTTILFKDSDKVKKGDLITDDHVDLSESLKYRGAIKTQEYIVGEIQKIYSSQGQNINDKHIEIILKQMFSKSKINEPGDSMYLQGQVINKLEIAQENEKLKEQGKKTIEFEEILLGISRVALKTDSFLSAASFQETTGILLDAAIQGKVDKLKGLKENVIIGRLIPAGTGLRGVGEKDADN